MKTQTIDDLDVRGKRVFVRVDFNIPLDGTQAITDDTRIVAALPTIRALTQKKAKVVLASHLGRPKGKPTPEFSLKPVAQRLSQLLDADVTFAPDCVGADTEKVVSALKEGEVVLLENLRFHAEEEKNDPAFAKELAALADVYVNDAFGTAHRAHASTEGITKFLSVRAPGYLMQKELDFLGTAVTNPVRPFVAILGGSKISGKIDVITNLMGTVDALLVGGAMMFTFYKAQGLETGTSLVETEKVDLARELLAAAKERNVRLLLPVDTVVAREVKEGADSQVADVTKIPQGWAGVDIGPKTRTAFSAEIAGAKTVVWNGPMGVFEIPEFAEGTLAVAQEMAKATRTGTTTIIGGGDSAAAISQAGLEKDVSHVSTGGGASLEFLEGKVLPGVAALAAE